MNPFVIRRRIAWATSSAVPDRVGMRNAIEMGPRLCLRETRSHVTVFRGGEKIEEAA
jgi:hypothetical protein